MFGTTFRPGQLASTLTRLLAMRQMTNYHQSIVQRGYDRVAEAYSHLEGDQCWPRMKWLGKALAKLDPASAILDLGCGSGDPADVEIAKLHEVTGVDISRTQVELARRNVPNGRIIHADLGALDFPAGEFDAVVSFYTLEHLPREPHRQILDRIHDWLRPGGLLLFSYEAGEIDDVTGEWLGVPMFFSTFDTGTITRLVKEAGFEIVETETETQLERDREVPYLWVLAQKV